MKSKAVKTVIYIIFYFLYICLANKTASSQIPEVLIGDTVAIDGIGANPPDPTCIASSSEDSHKSGTDFFIPPHPPLEFPAPSGGTIMFAPKTVGIQRDTFFLYVIWTCSTSTTVGPFPVVAKGISDSVIECSSIGGSTITYEWDNDSNKYISHYTGSSKKYEIINNVEDATTFDFQIKIDPTAPIQTMIAFDGDSVYFPHSFILNPMTRRKQGNFYFFTNSKGFDSLVIFTAIIKVRMRNPTFDDSINLKYYIQFFAKPTSSVSSFYVDLENIFIISVINNHEISLISNLYQSQSASLQLFDALGRPQPLPISELQIPAGENSQKIDIGNLPSGWYMLRMKMKD